MVFVCGMTYGLPSANAFLLLVLAAFSCLPIMALRVWLAVLAMLAALAAGYAIGRTPSRGTVALRSEHSQPAVKTPPGFVAVTQGGRTFHDPNCRYIHGPIGMIPAEVAVAEGYTPCVRCMHKTLEK